jgi:glycosyltransferase involved in cell wall biosynthesis
VGGLQSTVITEETGLLVPPLDEVAFAGAIDRILANSVWRDQLGEVGRKRVVARFTWSQVAKDLGQLYEKLLEDQETTETMHKA